MSFPHFASHFVNSPRTLSFVRQHEPPNPRCEGAEEQTAQTNGIGEGLEVDAHPPQHTFSAHRFLRTFYLGFWRVVISCHTKTLKYLMLKVIPCLNVSSRVRFTHGL